MFRIRPCFSSLLIIISHAMNKTIVLAILLLISLSLQSQEVKPEVCYKNQFRGGAGFFHVFPAGSNGTSIWLEYTRKLKTGLDIAFKVQHSQANMVLGSYWGPWEGQTKPDIFYVVDISFSKNFPLAKRHFLEPGLGIMLQRGYSWLPPFEIINGNHIVFKPNYGDRMDDIGISFKADYYYSLTETFNVGLRVQSCYLWPMWIENIVATPILSVRF